MRPYVGRFALVLVAGGLSGVGPVAGEPSSPDLPETFRQILPRGRIASVDSPRFVPASEAEIPDDAWVLGVDLEGAAKAYSLNLLNRHEVVNDRFGDRPVAAVW